jgi:hypothetical protein
MEVRRQQAVDSLAESFYGRDCFQCEIAHSLNEGPQSRIRAV